MTYSPEPWTLEATDLCGKPSAFVRDASGTIIGFFYDWHDAERMVERERALRNELADAEAALNDEEEEALRQCS